MHFIYTNRSLEQKSVRKFLPRMTHFRLNSYTGP